MKPQNRLYEVTHEELVERIAINFSALTFHISYKIISIRKAVVDTRNGVLFYNIIIISLLKATVAAH